MKQPHKIIILLAYLLIHASCQGNRHIENELHGLWQVVTIEKLKTGERTSGNGELYYTFQRNLVLLGYKEPTIPTGQMMENFIAHFDLYNDSISMGGFRTYSPTGDMSKENAVPISKLNKFGIYQEYTNFAMCLHRDKLTFTSDSAQIILRKY